MYLSIHFAYGSLDEWIGKKPICLSQLSSALDELTDDNKMFKMLPRLFLDNISDIPVLEVLFGDTLMIVELGDTGRVIYEHNDEITRDTINDINKIVDKYSSVSRVSCGVKFEVR